MDISHCGHALGLDFHVKKKDSRNNKLIHGAVRLMTHLVRLGYISSCF